MTGLADAFAQEVAARLPELQAAVVRDDRIGDAIRHAHTLASSAAVLGEAAAARAARACEQLLLPYADSGPPADVLALAAGEAEAVALLLAPWLLHGAA